MQIEAQLEPQMAVVWLFGAVSVYLIPFRYRGISDKRSSVEGLADTSFAAPAPRAGCLVTGQVVIDHQLLEDGMTPGSLPGRITRLLDRNQSARLTRVQPPRRHIQRSCDGARRGGHLLPPSKSEYVDSLASIALPRFGSPSMKSDIAFMRSFCRGCIMVTLTCLRPSTAFIERPPLCCPLDRRSPGASSRSILLAHDCPVEIRSWATDGHWKLDSARPSEQAPPLVAAAHVPLNCHRP
jgi:hypothetical protein